MKEQFFHSISFFEKILVNNGISSNVAYYLNIAILIGIILSIAYIANYITKRIIVQVIKRWVDHSENEWDDIFYERGVFNALSHLAPALVIMWMTPLVLFEYPGWIKFVEKTTSIYMIVVVLIVFLSFIKALHDIYKSLPISNGRSIKGYVQVVNILVYFIAIMLIVSTLFNTNFSKLLTSLGAMTAVLLFVFKDAILGLIAGIQISANDILKIGDYIEMPSKGADGTVIDISLNTVKVLNTNKTITPIPTYAFVNESFQNWRGLELSVGRRIKRNILIDIRSITFCNEKQIEEFENNELLKEVIENSEDKSMITNMKLYRMYIENYLRNHPLVLKQTGYNLLVRELQPNENGVPMEIFVYISEKDFTKYEHIQADFFDHFFAIANRFGIRIFQNYTNDQGQWI